MKSIKKNIKITLIQCHFTDISNLHLYINLIKLDYTRDPCLQITFIFSLSGLRFSSFPLSLIIMVK